MEHYSGAGYFFTFCLKLFT